MKKTHTHNKNRRGISGWRSGILVRARCWVLGKTLFFHCATPRSPSNNVEYSDNFSVEASLHISIFQLSIRDRPLWDVGADRKQGNIRFSASWSLSVRLSWTLRLLFNKSQIHVIILLFFFPLLISGADCVWSGKHWWIFFFVFPDLQCFSAYSGTGKPCKHSGNQK